jgi:dienelactone hydrolase
VSKKRTEEKRKKQKNKTLLYMGIGSIVFIAVLGFFFFAWYSQLPQDDTKLWTIDAAGDLGFGDRGSISARIESTDMAANYTLQKIVYKSFGDDVYALLRIPKNVTRPPVVVVIPAASITKEADHATAEALCDMGYASLTLDGRGNGGETTGDFEGNWTAGYDAFLKGGDPVQYKQVYDVLKGLDYVKSRSDLDGGNVSLLGESIGGMWAIVAAGIEPQFKGVITVSSSDFDFNGSADPGAVQFINAVMPSRYLGNITPRKLAMFQFVNDSLVPMADGKALYDKASEPKAWHLYNGTTHGLYDKAYAADLQAELKEMLGR